jgi:hypothetical protein
MDAVMKRKWVAALMMALSAVPVAGCGTVRNLLSEHPRPYGGLASDLGAVSSSGSSNGPSQPLFPQGYTGDPRGLLLGLALIVGIGATELCVTGLADTLCLPYFYLRDGELFPKDSPLDDETDATPKPALEPWPPPNLYWDVRGDSGEDKKEPAPPSRPLEHPSFLCLGDLVLWPDGGQAELAAAAGQPLAQAWKLPSTAASHATPVTVPPLPQLLKMGDLLPKGWPEVAKPGGVVVPHLAAHSFWEAQETATHPIAQSE